jgi:hypothetical protein
MQERMKQVCNPLTKQQVWNAWESNRKCEGCCWYKWRNPYHSAQFLMLDENGRGGSWCKKYKMCQTNQIQWYPLRSYIITYNWKWVPLWNDSVQFLLHSKTLKILYNVHDEECFHFQNYDVYYIPEETGAGNYRQENKAQMTANILTSLKAHQSRTKPSSRNSLSTVVRLKSRGQEPRFHSGFTSSWSSKSSLENSTLLPILKTTLSTRLKVSNF